MGERLVARLVLVQAVVIGLAGLALYAVPVEAARLWPWLLPPLAARFIGASLVAVAVGALLAARSGNGEGRLQLVALGVGALLLPLAGVLESGEERSSAGMAVLVVVLGFFAVVDVAFAAAGRLIAGRSTAGRPVPTDAADGAPPMPRSLRAFFLVHFLLVAPVGLSMLLVPVDVAPLWPWPLTPVNLRLLGAIFLGAAPVSLLAARTRTWSELRSTFPIYVIFAGLALVATAIHFSLFNPARIVTWVFVALYAFVVIGAAAGLLGLERRPSISRAAPAGR